MGSSRARSGAGRAKGRWAVLEYVVGFVWLTTILVALFWLYGTVAKALKKLWFG